MLSSSVDQELGLSWLVSNIDCYYSLNLKIILKFYWQFFGNSKLWGTSASEKVDSKFVLLLFFTLW